jgi:hypothetical protein
MKLIIFIALILFSGSMVMIILCLYGIGKVLENIEIDVIPEIHFEEFQYEDRVLLFRKPFSVTPIKIEELSMFNVNIPQFNIDAYGNTIEELKLNIKETLLMHWHEYANAADEVLSTKAIILKNYLRNQIREIQYSTR